jgi:hypothetical protein
MISFRGKNIRHPPNFGLGGHQRLYGRYVKQINELNLLETETRFVVVQPGSILTHTYNTCFLWKKKMCWSRWRKYSLSLGFDFLYVLYVMEDR